MRKQFIVVLAAFLGICGLVGCGSEKIQQKESTTAVVEKSQTETASPTVKEKQVKSEPAASEGAAPDEETKLIEENSVGLTNIKEGTYSVKVESSSSMFKIEKAELIVKDQKMVGIITLSGTGYSKLYMGTGAKAISANEADIIPFVEDEKSAYTFTIPVVGLDKAIDCAAFSQKKEEWYDRQITFISSSLTSDASIDESKEVGSSKIVEKDGTYTIELTLEGGSGKTTIASPAIITMTGETAVAMIQWNSPNYDYMIVDGVKYLPVNTEGDSVFEIPIMSFDKEMPVIANTIAMSKPHEIEYTITLHSKTMKITE